MHNKQHQKQKYSKKRGLVITTSVAVLAVIMLAAIAAWLNWWPFTQDHDNKSNQSNASQRSKSQPQPPTYAEQKLAAMSLRDKVASLFILHTPGTDPATLSNYISKNKSGGLIFMGDNIPDTMDALKAQTSALVIDKQLPPLIATDEEGGTVRRLPDDDYAGPQTLRSQPPSATKQAFSQRSDLLKSAGINLNFGIIADVTSDRNSFIYPRILGINAKDASDRVAQAVEGSKGKTLSTLKHFPGHGETPDNSHITIPAASTSFDDWQNRVSLPFKAGIDAGADLVMFGHLRYTAVDDQPATLSKKWHDIIRNNLGFKGLIITDDMIMLQDSGDAAYADPVKNAVSALRAGNDLLLYVLDHGDGSSSIDPDTLIDGVVAAVQSGAIKQSDLDETVKKVLEVRHDVSQNFSD
jgi:beta-N-acetylhexosaminidase